MGWLAQLAEIAGSQDQRAFLAAQADTLPSDAAALIHASLLVHLHTDIAIAERLASACEQLAALRGDPASKAFADRGRGHVLHLAGDHQTAVECYQRAVALFEECGQPAEVGRTLSSGLQALSYLSRYDQAKAWADRAEAIFLAQGDALRLARLDSNVGNICFRQDRPADALIRYQRALDGFRDSGMATDIVAVHSNLAVCQTNLGNFREALECYRLAREQADAHGLTVLAAQADYNIAFLYYQRGDYTEARRLYQKSRERCQASGDGYHDALCDLDEAEMDLELNLSAEAEVLAQAATQKFERLGMRYEQAKALVNAAGAASQLGDPGAADKALIAARRLFVGENNLVWSALVDQFRAVLAFHGGRFDLARRLSSSAWRVLTGIMVPHRAAHSQILLARLWLRTGHADRARAAGREAISCLGEAVSPSLQFQAEMLEGEIDESQGKWQDAKEHYFAARRAIEALRGRLENEDLRISVLKDKVALYEALVSLCVNPPSTSLPVDLDCALSLVQEAKSRGLAEQTQSPLQEDLRWLYRQIQAATEKGAPTLALRERAARLEASLADQQPPDAVPQQLNLADLQASIPEHAVILEYFEARGSLSVFVIGRTLWRHVWLGSSAPVRHAARLLRFQLGKFRVDAESAGLARTLAATDDHLRQLHKLLIAPLEHTVSGYGHLIIAPHRFLHGLPFTALNDGQTALIDRFTLSATPSAQVFVNCRARTPGATGSPVVMAVTDDKAPEIAAEGAAVSAVLQAALVGNDQATLAAFTQHASQARILHLATHGFFRADNPMFSSLQLSGRQLSLAEIPRIQVSTRLLTLSACNTGSGVSVGADEVLGLMRTFLAAGARSLLLSLWEVDDSSTRQFMGEFYARLNRGATLSSSVAGAATAVRNQNPHPYYWAPFVLVGDPEALDAQKA